MEQSSRSFCRPSPPRAIRVQQKRTIAKGGGRSMHCMAWKAATQSFSRSTIDSWNRASMTKGMIPCFMHLSLLTGTLLTCFEKTQIQHPSSSSSQSSQSRQGTLHFRCSLISILDPKLHICKCVLSRPVHCISMQPTSKLWKFTTLEHCECRIPKSCMSFSAWCLCPIITMASMSADIGNCAIEQREALPFQLYLSKSYNVLMKCLQC